MSELNQAAFCYPPHFPVQGRLPSRMEQVEASPGILRSRARVLALMVVGLVGGAASGDTEAGIIEGVNHTHRTINWFSVDGR